MKHLNIIITPSCPPSHRATVSNVGLGVLMILLPQVLCTAHGVLFNGVVFNEVLLSGVSLHGGVGNV